MTDRRPYLALLFGLALALGSATALGAIHQTGIETDTEAQRLVFLLQYIGLDYGNAVADGAIISVFEYAEMMRMSDEVLQGWTVLRPLGAAQDVLLRLILLQKLIAERAPPSEVSGLVQVVVTSLVADLSLLTLPTSPPDPQRGRALYDVGCAACHGIAGDGHGFAAVWLDPPPTSFHEDRVHSLSPHQVYGAARFGIDGTAMPSYLDAYTNEQLWDIAFFVLTMRADFAPASDDPALRLTLSDVATLSGNDLIARLEEQGQRAAMDAMDWYRRSPPEFRAPSEDADTPLRPALATDAASGLAVALSLQDTFADVAARVLPSVVGIGAYVRDPTAPTSVDDIPSWQAADALLYPGFARINSGSGFFVDAEGLILTAATVISREDGEIADAVDVELPDGSHVLAHVVGVEPTVNLAVLRMEAVSDLRPPTIIPISRGRTETLKVGHWTLALGDPPGPARIFAVGTLSSTPARQCYQADLMATLLQTAMTVHSHATGGPLVDIHGNVIGMLVPPPPGRALSGSHMQLALPIDLALNLSLALQVSESRRSPWLGVAVLELARQRRLAGAQPDLPLTGVYIDDVFDPSPAWKAGIRVGDCLVAIDGQRLFSVLDFQKWLYLSGIDKEVELELYRDGETSLRRVTIEERPASAAR